MLRAVGDGTDGKMIVIKETEIKVCKDEDDGELEDGSLDDQVEELETMIKELALDTIDDKDTLKFAGFSEQISSIKEVLELKINQRDSSKVKIKGVLIHGPSGIGKTMAIQSLLSELKVHTVVISPKHLVQVRIFAFI